MYIVLCVFLGLVLFFSIYIYKTYSEVSYIQSDIDNKIYMIRRGHNKSDAFLKESANTLAQINLRIEKLINELENRFGNDLTKIYFIKKLKSNYNPYMISEAAIDNRYTSYTVDKEDINMCLRTRDKYEKVYDINTLMYVVLHELAHLCNYSADGIAIEGHGKEFKRIFTILVQTSMDIGIYTYKNYHDTPEEYCGISINTNIVG